MKKYLLFIGVLLGACFLVGWSLYGKKPATDAPKNATNASASTASSAPVMPTPATNLLTKNPDGSMLAKINVGKKHRLSFVLPKDYTLSSSSIDGDTVYYVAPTPAITQPHPPILGIVIGKAPSVLPPVTSMREDYIDLYIVKWVLNPFKTKDGVSGFGADAFLEVAKKGEDPSNPAGLVAHFFIRASKPDDIAKFMTYCRRVRLS